MTYLELMNRFWDLDQASTGLITFTPGQTSRCAAIYEIIGFDCSLKEADLAFFESKRLVDENVQNYSVRMNEKVNAVENDRVNEIVNVNNNVNDNVNEVMNEKATRLDTIPDGFEEADFVSGRTDERTCEQITERSSEQSPDPYIRIDKDKEEDQDQEAIINNLPWERFDLRKKYSQEIWDPEKIVNRFNEICTSLRKVKFLKAYTRKMLTDRNAHFRSSKDWDVFFHKVANSDFLNGKNEYQWQADLEWLVKDDETVLSILQGEYDNDVCETVSFDDPVNAQLALG